MKSKRLLLLVVLGAWAFLGTGCEWGRWLRLLSFKKQLANLERYARVEDQHGLTLHFLKPVVYTGDLQLLVEGDAFRTTNQNSQTWLWAYEKQSLAPSASAHDFDLSFTAIFENDKFTELRFPERFLAVLPKPLILGMLRSLGQAEVDMKHGTVNIKWVGGGKDKVELPAKPQLTALLAPRSLLPSRTSLRLSSISTTKRPLPHRRPHNGSPGPPSPSPETVTRS